MIALRRLLPLVIQIQDHPYGAPCRHHSDVVLSEVRLGSDNENDDDAGGFFCDFLRILRAYQKKSRLLNFSYRALVNSSLAFPICSVCFFETFSQLFGLTVRKRFGQSHRSKLLRGYSMLQLSKIKEQPEDPIFSNLVCCSQRIAEKKELACSKFECCQICS